MSIRFATAGDIHALVELGKRMHAITRFRDYDYDAQRVARALNVAIGEAGGDRHLVLVAQSGEGGEAAIVGVLLATLERHIFSDRITANIMHFDVLPERRMGGWAVRLLVAFEKWARNRRIVEIGFGINSGDEYEKAGQFARRMGFEKVGENYVKVLKAVQ